MSIDATNIIPGQRAREAFVPPAIIAHKKRAVTAPILNKRVPKIGQFVTFPPDRIQRNDLRKHHLSIGEGRRYEEYVYTEAEYNEVLSSAPMDCSLLLFKTKVLVNSTGQAVGMIVKEKRDFMSVLLHAGKIMTLRRSDLTKVNIVAPVLIGPIANPEPVNPEPALLALEPEGDPVVPAVEDVAPAIEPGGVVPVIEPGVPAIEDVVPAIEPVVPAPINPEPVDLHQIVNAITALNTSICGRMITSEDSLRDRINALRGEVNTQQAAQAARIQEQSDNIASLAAHICRLEEEQGSHIKRVKTEFEYIRADRVQRVSESRNRNR
jgi:hypothetical protein